MKKDSLHWIGDSTVYPRQTFYFYPQLCSSYFWGDSLPERVLAQRVFESNEFRYETEADSLTTDSLVYMPVAMSRRWGKGEVIFSFHSFDFYQLRNVGRQKCNLYLPFVVADGEASHRSHGGVHERNCTGAAITFPLSVGTSAASLGFVSDDDYHHTLYDIHSEEAATEVIPVIHEPANKSLEFTELIGTLYFQKKDHADLVRKKFSYLAEELSERFRWILKKWPTMNALFTGLPGKPEWMPERLLNLSAKSDP